MEFYYSTDLRSEDRKFSVFVTYLTASRRRNVNTDFEDGERYFAYSGFAELDIRI